MERETNHHCSTCPALSQPLSPARPAIVQLAADGQSWRLQPPDTPVHLAALFRDPGIAKDRLVEYVLDLRERDGRLVAGAHCWVQGFTRALAGLPPGLTVALDNGVRCPTPRDPSKSGVYAERAGHCHGLTADWFASLHHPDGGKPGLVICDKDLACALAGQQWLKTRSGETWSAPRRFVEAVGDEVAYLGADALILAHPVIFARRHARTYAAAFADKDVVGRLTRLARW